MVILAAVFVFFIWLAIYTLLERFSGFTYDESFFASLAVLLVFGLLFQKKSRELIERKLKRRLENKSEKGG